MQGAHATTTVYGSIARGEGEPEEFDNPLYYKYMPSMCSWLFYRTPAIRIDWLIDCPCQHDNGYMDGQSLNELHTDIKDQHVCFSSYLYIKVIVLLNKLD